MEEAQFKPSSIIVDVENRLMQIIWADGHESIYDFAALRRACPCAECRPWVHGVGAIGEMPESVHRAVSELKSASDVSAVGSYAINLRWADGHSSGIYTFEYLRSICPCEEHSSQHLGEDRRP